MRRVIDARNSDCRAATSEQLAKPRRRIRPGALLLVVPLLAALPACDDGPETEGDCQGSQCPIVAGAPVVVATSSADTAVLGLTLATSSDGASMAVGWTELSDKDALHATTSSDSGATFGDAMLVAPPEDVELSALRLLMPDGAGVLAGAVAHFPDPDGGPSHAWPVVHQASSPGAVFEPLVDLKSVLGDRSLSQGAFVASEDGKTLVWAWVDTTPADWLAPDAAPTDSLLASISTDSGKTFSKPRVVSATPFLATTRITAFVRDGQAGVIYAEAREIPGEPVPVGIPALALLAEDGEPGEPILIAADEYGAIPAGGAPGADGAAPGAAVGPDGSIHVAWWSALTVGLWYAVSLDGATFSEPVRLFETLTPTPTNLRLAVDGAGTAWIAALDQSTVRVIQVPPGAEPIEQVDAAAPLASTGDTFDIAGLPGEGAMQLWWAAADEEAGTEPALQLRRIGR